MYLYTWLFIYNLYNIFYNYIKDGAKESASLGSVSHQSKLSNLNRELWKPHLQPSQTEMEVTHEFTICDCRLK